MGFNKIALSLARIAEKLQDVKWRIKTNNRLAKWTWRAKEGLRHTGGWIRTYRHVGMIAAGAAAVAACAFYTAGAYREAVSAMDGSDPSAESIIPYVYRVYADGRLIGEVSSPDVVRRVIAMELDRKRSEHPELEWELDEGAVRIEKAPALWGEPDDVQTAEALFEALEPTAVGVEVVVDGKAVAVVKDEATAQRVLDRVKTELEQSDILTGLVILSSDSSQERDDDVLAEGKPELLSSRIVEEVQLLRRKIRPNDVMDENAVVEMLLQGDTKPTKYVVQEGDTPIGIAKKMNVPLQLLYMKNQDHRDLIERDLIRPGDELDLTVQRPAISIETVERGSETIAVQYETIYEEDPTMRKGQTKTVREGVKGVKQVTYLLTKVNGLLMEEEAIDEVILQEPVPAIVKRGTKIILGEGTGKFSWPVLNPNVTSNFGKRWGRQHKGIDITSKNKNVLASDTGKVVYAGFKSDYGNHIIIDHQNGYKTLYAHLSKILVKKGDIVEKGEKIGIMGSTGRSTGVHLHFEIIVNGVEKNPRSYLSSK